MKTLLILISFVSAIAQAESLVFHEIRGDETLWFLAEVYYGKGQMYPKIAEANSVNAETKLEKNRRLLIPDPVFNPDEPSFEGRFAQLQKLRAEKLAHRLNKQATQAVVKAKTKVLETIDKQLELEKPVKLERPAQTAEAELRNQ